MTPEEQGELGRYKHEVHCYLDTLWLISTNKSKARNSWYNWLALQMGKERELFIFKLEMLEPLEPFIKLNPQLVNCAVPFVLVIIKGILIINILSVNFPEKSKVSPAFSFPAMIFPFELK